MDLSYEFLRGLIILGVFIVGGTWFIIRWIKKSVDDPGVLITKWILSAVLLFICGGIAFSGSPVAPLLVMIPSVFLALVWAPNIGNLVAKPLTSMFDGGDEEVEAKPFYSIANAHRMKSRFPEAIGELRVQLAKFPNDYQGQLLLATIQAEDMNDMAAAEETINNLLTQSHPAGQIAAVLNLLADWHLKYNRDSYSAKQALEKIRDLFPDSEVSNLAAQRLASLGSGYVAPTNEQRQPVVITEHVTDLGLNPDAGKPAPAEDNPVALANQYVGHLQNHPDDWETREKLALIYASHYQRLDLAVAELEQLVSGPNQPVKHVVRWLNTIAELQIKYADDNRAARQTLQRIAARYPGSAHASQALEQIVRLTNESKTKKTSQGMPLGSYDQDIGLKS